MPPFSSSFAKATCIGIVLLELATHSILNKLDESHVDSVVEFLKDMGVQLFVENQKENTSHRYSCK
ncbi:hypothetical protein Sjap_002820 [Stephania japonica]|uniref:Uncharacterized protein n=1 Tax=Stephania japonica TaxID=461633 RepID=A0AAP0KQ75_9MAGN